MATEISKGDDKGGYRQINKALNICAFDDYLKSQAASLPHLPDVEQLTPRVLRVLGQNPGKFTFQGTNTFVIGTGTSRILVDTSGGEPEYAALLASALEARAISLKYVLITHWHGDHSGGAPDLARMYPHLKENIYKNDPEQSQQNIRDGQIFRVQGATITAVLGHGTSAVEDLGLYMSSLQKMAGKNCITGYPAHGVTIDDLHAKIGTELAQKWRREKQVMGTLERLRERGEKSVIVRDLVTGIYGDAVDESTRTMALEPFIDEVLRKLAGDGRVGFEIRSRQKRWHSVPKKRCNRDMKFVQSAMQVQVCKVFDID
jgi:hypothetical protein